MPRIKPNETADFKVGDATKGANLEIKNANAVAVTYTISVNGAAPKKHELNADTIVSYALGMNGTASVCNTGGVNIEANLLYIV
jgi:hypothetical protein